MTVAQNDILEVSARAEFNGVEDIVNVFQFQKVDAVPTSDALVVDDIIDILEAFYTALLTLQSVLTIYRDLRVSNITQGTVLGTFGWKTLTTGSSPAIPNPPGAALLLSLNTNVARVTPRKYIGGLVTGTMEADGTFASFVTAAGVIASILLLGTIVETNGQYDFGYLSPKTLSFVTPVSSTVTDIPAYQRRRKQGRGS